MNAHDSPVYPWPTNEAPNAERAAWIAVHDTDGVRYRVRHRIVIGDDTASVEAKLDLRGTGIVGSRAIKESPICTQFIGEKVNVTGATKKLNTRRAKAYLQRLMMTALRLPLLG